MVPLPIPPPAYSPPPSQDPTKVELEVSPGDHHHILLLLPFYR